MKVMGLALECPVCSSQRFRSLFSLKSADVVACQTCDAVYVPSPLPEVTSIYRSSYFMGDSGAHGYMDYAREIEAHEKVFTERLMRTEPLMGGRGRLLDIGCALGHFGKVARARGWDTFVTDISEFAVESSVSDYGLQGFVCPVGKLPVKPEAFDLVTLFDVIEHLSHPKDLLLQIRKALDPRGLLYITTPDISSWSAKLMGRHWYHLKPEEHLVYFSPTTIQMILESCGFEVIRVQPSRTSMAVGDILSRLRRYSKTVFDGLLALAKFLGFERRVIPLYTGEMEIWARPLGQQKKKRKVFTVDPEPSPILSVVCCPNCGRDLIPSADEMTCTGCNSAFEFRHHVINFSKYAKRSFRKVSSQ